MRRVALLDRDGTINVDTGYTHLPSEWQFTDRAPQALKMVQDAGFALAIVTGQSGIGRGMYDEATMHALHAYMRQQLAPYGVHIDAIAFCPHIPEDNCQCRKPKTGMAKMIEQQLGPIDYTNSWMIGDKVEDVGFGNAIGVHTALITSRYWKEDEIKEKPEYIVASLYDAATRIA